LVYHEDMVGYVSQQQVKWDTNFALQIKDEDYFLDMSKKLDTLIQHDHHRDALSYLGSLLKVEVYVNMKQFEEACKLFDVSKSAIILQLLCINA
jgi:hypothetical protein